MNIRPAGAADAAAIAAIWNPVIRETEITFNSVGKSDAEIAGMIGARTDAGHAFLVAEERGTLAGFAHYGQFRAGAGYARTMEHTIILSPGARGQGIGRRLLAAIEHHAAVRGAHTMFAGVSSGNPAGRAFHARMGYAEVVTLAEVGWKFGRWFDLHLMQKRLGMTDSAGGTG